MSHIKSARSLTGTPKGSNHRTRTVSLPTNIILLRCRCTDVLSHKYPQIERENKTIADNLPSMSSDISLFSFHAKSTYELHEYVVNLGSMVQKVHAMI
jgi:hypothetical protein